MKFIRDNFANISKITFTLSTFTLLTAKEFIFTELSKPKSIIILVLGFCKALSKFWLESLNVFFRFF